MRDSSRGFTLVEVLVATAIFTVAIVSIVRLFGLAALADRAAHRVTLAPALAAERLEQLQSLAWEIDAAGGARADTTTDLSRSPAGPGGTGLQPSPAGALDRDTPGFVDYLGEDGRWLGSGPGVPAGARFVRRWAIAPLSGDPSGALVVEVVVLPASASRDPGRPVQAWTHLAGVRVRTLG